MKPALSPACVLFLFAATLSAQGGWSAPVFEPALNSTAADTAPQLSTDGLTLYFSSFRSGNWELYSSTRPYPGGPWSAPALVTELSDPATDDQPFLAVGDLELWFSSQRAGGLGSLDILRTTRTSTSQPWDPPTFVTELNSTGSDTAVSLTADGLEVFFLTTGWGAPAAPNNAIFKASRAAVGLPFGTPTLVTELSNSNTHRDCEISADGLSIVYTEFVNPRLHVLYAERPDRTSPFGAPVIWSEFDNVGTSIGVYSFTRSLTGNEAFLAAGFPSAAGGQEIMSTRRPIVYGAGCGSPPLSLSCPAPVLGSNWDFTTGNIDPSSPISVTFFGNVQTSIPLGFLGAPGCSAHIDALNGSLNGVSIGGTSVVTLPLPLNLSLMGASLTAQSVCLTPSNLLGLLTSNGIEATLGL